MTTIYAFAEIGADMIKATQQGVSYNGTAPDKTNSDDAYGYYNGVDNGDTSQSSTKSAAHGRVDQLVLTLALMTAAMSMLLLVIIYN